WIQGRHYEIGRQQRIGRSASGDLQLRHRFQQGRLSLRSCPIYLIAEQNMTKDRPGLKAEIASSICTGEDDPSSGNIGRHQVDSELNPIETEIKDQAQCFDQGGFARARHSFNQNMTASEQGAQQLLNGTDVANNDLVNLSLDPSKDSCEISDCRLFRRRRWG